MCLESHHGLCADAEFCPGIKERCLVFKKWLQMAICPSAVGRCQFRVSRPDDADLCTFIHRREVTFLNIVTVRVAGPETRLASPTGWGGVKELGGGGWDEEN